jgi:hypothetical protein
VKAAILLLLLSLPAVADFAAGKRAFQGGDYATALKELLPLAKQGNASAQFYLGVMYHDGQGVPLDDNEALRWYRAAADQGDALAQSKLAIMYEYGQGVPLDHKEAAKWYRLAAEQGDAVAQFSLGLMYVRGEGVPQDYVQAHMWLNLAAAAGDAGSIKERDITARKMTPDQIAEAQRLAREWKPKTSR